MQLESESKRILSKIFKTISYSSNIACPSFINYVVGISLLKEVYVGMELLFYLIVGGIIGWISSEVMGKGIPGGIIGYIITGVLGAWIGGELLGIFGPIIGGIAVFPALIGSIILIFLIGLAVKAIK